MKQNLIEYLVCPVSREKLNLEVSKRNGEEILEGKLNSPSGKSYPIIGGIPRFVISEKYAGNFGFEWKKHSRIYFDEKDRFRVHSTRSQLERKLGLSAEKINNRLVLEAGCGTGDCASILTEWGAKEIFCVDLSAAVEASYANNKQLPNVHVVQADLFNLPFAHDCFDVIYSKGVLHHTPDTKKAFLALIPFLKKNGIVAIWVYSDCPGFQQRWSDSLRKITTRLNPRLLYFLCCIAIPAYYVYKVPLLGKLIFHFLPNVSTEPYWEDRVLDTFDWYSPKYQFKHNYPEVFRWFQEANLNDIHLLDVPVSIWGKK